MCSDIVHPEKGSPKDPSLSKSSSNEPYTKGAIGLIAGNGEFPREFILKAQGAGHPVYVYALKGEASGELSQLADDLTWGYVGNLQGAIRYFKKQGVPEVAMLGGVKRVNVFRLLHFDWLMLRAMKNARGRQDDGLLRSICAEIERAGLRVFNPKRFLSQAASAEGCLTLKPLSDSEREDRDLGIRAARLLGSLDVGQTVVVKGGVVVALEAVEGTDATIKRAGQLAGPGVVVVKLPKPGQDRRLDLPSIGPETINNLKDIGARALIIEKEGALILEPEKVIQLADSCGITIEVIPSSEPCSAV